MIRNSKGSNHQPFIMFNPLRSFKYQCKFSTFGVKNISSTSKTCNFLLIEILKRINISILMIAKHVYFKRTLFIIG